MHFFNMLFWNLNYQVNSTMGGKVEWPARPGKTLIKVLVSAMDMTSLGYPLPLMAATGVNDVALDDGRSRCRLHEERRRFLVCGGEPWGTRRSCRA
ncbi:hypothetical protein SEVIR_9G425001v4 [Setaria viridis]